MRMEDADTPLFRTLLVCGEALNIPITNVKLGDNGFEYPVLLPQDVLLALAKQGCAHKLISAPLKQASKTLTEFWHAYRLAYPRHELFELGLSDYSNVVPYFLHGDGGRTFKRDSIVITSMYPTLGRGTSKCQVSAMQPSTTMFHGRKRKRDDANAANTNEVTMGINLLGNSLGNRFMFCAIHNKYIKEDPSVFYDLLKLWGQELAALLDGGIQVEGRVFRIAILGLTGDAPFLRDAGYMTRSFNNIRKSADSTALLATASVPGVGGRGGRP